MRKLLLFFVLLACSMQLMAQKWVRVNSVGYLPADVKVAVLKYRSRIIWRSIVFFLISLLSVSLIWWIIDHIDIHVNKPEIEMPVQTDTTVLDMRVSEPVYKAAPVPVKVQDTEESLDATSLDEMFKEASEKL